MQTPTFFAQKSMEAQKHKKADDSIPLKQYTRNENLFEHRWVWNEERQQPYIMLRDDSNKYSEIHQHNRSHYEKHQFE